MTNLQVEYNKLLETKRNNEAQLAEMKRSHQATEAITSWKNQQDVNVALGNLAVNQAKAAIEADKAAEAARHNVATEKLTSWSTAVTAKHYSNQDSIAAYNAKVNAVKAQSEVALNEAKVNQGWSNIANDMTKFTQQLAVEKSKVDVEMRKLAETQRHNTTTENETLRNNLANQFIGAYKTLPTLSKVGMTGSIIDHGMTSAAKALVKLTQSGLRRN